MDHIASSPAFIKKDNLIGNFQPTNLPPGGSTVGW
jgi:hypothetical protein